MTDARLAELVERAFDYRGYVTLRRTDGSELVGFVYDRSASHLDLYDETATRRVRVSLADVADIAFTGDDAARKAQALWERRKGTLEPRETSAWGEWRESGPVLLLVALDRELRSVARALGLVRRGDRARGQSGGNEVVGLALGVGGGARRAVVDEQPRLVVSCGFSGALDPALAPGDLVLATAVRDETGDELAAPPLIRQRRRWAACAISRASSSAPPQSQPPRWRSWRSHGQARWRSTWRAIPSPARRPPPAFPGSRSGRSSTPSGRPSQPSPGTRPVVTSGRR